MRVLLVSSLYPSAYAPNFGIFVKRQVDALAEQGVEVILVKSPNAEPRRRLFWKYSQLAWQAVKSTRRTFDVVHVHYPTFAGVLGGLIALVRRKPLVVTLHGGEIDETQYEELNFFKQWMTRISVGCSLCWANAIITVGPGLAELLKMKGIPTHKVSVINMGVDCQVFHPRPKDEVRSYLGFHSDSPLIISVGALIPIKGLEYLIRAASLLRKQYPECSWYLVGSGPLESSLRMLAEKLGISDKVIFVGRYPADQVALWAAAADVFVMPSLTEGFGLAALEAMACGTPVIASNVGGLRYLIKDRLNGFLVPPANPEAIAHRVQQLLSNPDLRRKMGRNGIDTARQHDLRLQAQKVRMIYEYVVQPCGNPG